jgi:hypothetical protein
MLELRSLLRVAEGLLVFVRPLLRKLLLMR